MGREEDISILLQEKFSFLENRITIPRPRRIFVETPRDEFLRVISFLADHLCFDQLCTITGLDVGEDLQLIYHLAEGGGVLLNLRVKVPKSDPVIPSILSINKGAIFYERELVDLLGAEITGLPEGDRYPLPDDWPAGQYPLRKDWKADQLTKREEA